MREVKCKKEETRSDRAASTSRLAYTPDAQSTGTSGGYRRHMCQLRGDIFGMALGSLSQREAMRTLPARKGGQAFMNDLNQNELAEESNIAFLMRHASTYEAWD